MRTAISSIALAGMTNAIKITEEMDLGQEVPVADDLVWLADNLIANGEDMMTIGSKMIHVEDKDIERHGKTMNKLGGDVYGMGIYLRAHENMPFYKDFQGDAFESCRDCSSSEEEVVSESDSESDSSDDEDAVVVPFSDGAPVVTPAPIVPAPVVPAPVEPAPVVAEVPAETDEGDEADDEASADEGDEATSDVESETE